MKTKRIPGLMTALTLTTLTGVALVAQPAAHAQATQITAASGLSAGDPTLTYTGTVGNIIPSYTSTAGGQTITITDAGNKFRFTQEGGGYTGGFANGTNLLEAENGSGGNPTGPMTITFSTGVSQVGFSAQNEEFGTDDFSFSAYNGATLLGAFTDGPVNDASGTVLSFIGVDDTGGPAITSLVVSDTSSIAGHSNQMAFGPLTFAPAAVTTTPEPASYAAFAMGGLGLLGLSLKARKRRSVV